MVISHIATFTWKDSKSALEAVLLFDISADSSIFVYDIFQIYSTLRGICSVDREIELMSFFLIQGEAFKGSARIRHNTEL